MLVLLKSLQVLLEHVCQYSEVFPLTAIAMPTFLYIYHKMTGSGNLAYTKYVVCIKCYKLYKFDECIETIGGVSRSKRCTNILFPRHPQKQHRQKCSQLLLTQYTTASGKKMLYPWKTYCYLSVQSSLKLLASRKGFVERCELWRNRKCSENVYSDIYDGKIWKKFNNPNKHNFLTEKHNYALTINLDWFCPYKHVKSYSVGVIYGVINNLPRSERFKRENLLIIGIIPSMAKEPPVQTFIEPFVEEMMVAWKDGFYFNFPDATVNPTRFKLAVILVGCDIPACRKLGGFLG